MSTPVTTRWDLAQFRNRVFLKATLTTETGLRVASGLSEGMSAADITVIKDVLGRPYVPGSSFKGVLRSTVERLVRSFNRQPPQHPWTCNPLVNDERCIRSEVMQGLRRQYPDDAQLSAQVLARSCDVCLVFGSPWLASKVLVKDLLVQEWWGHYSVRSGVGINRDTGTAEEGMFYDYEFVPPGTRFMCEILAENLSAEEQGLLLLGLREFQAGRAQLGGGRSRGLGWVRLGDWEQARYVDGSQTQALLEYLRGAEGRPLNPTQLQECVNAFITWVQQAGR